MREQGHRSATTPSPFPLPPGCASQRPQGSRAGSPYLGPVACSLPACRPTGVLRPGPRSAAASGEAASVSWAASPAPHAARLGPPCIFNNVYYSCFVTGKEPEPLTEKPRTAGRAGQWACSTAQPPGLCPTCWPSASENLLPPAPKAAGPGGSLLIGSAASAGAPIPALRSQAV